MSRKRDPMLLGLPSPSLRKMQKMTLEELAGHADRLATEAGHVQRRIEAMSEQAPQPTDHLEMLQRQLERLNTLEKIARDRIAGKPPGPEMQQAQNNDRPRRTSRSYYERGGGYSRGNPRRQRPSSPPPTGGGYQ